MRARTLGSERCYFDFVEAKKKGYHISILGLYASRDICKERIAKREKEEGRAITDEILDEYRARFSALWPYYLKLVDEIFLFQTNNEMQKLIFSKDDGIKDPQTYQQFLDEGVPFYKFFHYLAEK